MLIKKTLSSLTAILFVAAVIFFLPEWVYVSVVILVVGSCLYEFYSLFRNLSGIPLPWLGLILGCTIPAAAALSLERSNSDIEHFCLVLLVLLAFFYHIFSYKGSKDAFLHLLILIFGWLYIGWFFAFFIKIKALPRGSLLVAFLILVTKSGDIIAYFVGKSIGKRTLLPHISPKKTVEGSMAGLAASLLASVLGRNMIGANVGQALILGGFLGVLAQFGDLTESFIKRAQGVKDTGKLVPGFGGLMDMIDSLFLAGVVFYFYARYLL